MSKLPRDAEKDIAQEVLGVLEGTGYTSEELIPGLCLAIKQLAGEFPHPGPLLDEAVDMLQEED